MGKCSFQDTWLQLCDENGRKYDLWLKKSNTNEDKGFCILCNSSFSVVKGIQGVNQHVKTEKHKLLYRARFSSQQLKIIDHDDEVSNLSHST